ncbi:hypothetical protein FHS80_000140 [Porphyromonas circumdentaria]|nr:hypothetical protein [Porphyromonas circumdentaria]
MMQRFFAEAEGFFIALSKEEEVAQMKVGL